MCREHMYGALNMYPGYATEDNSKLPDQDFCLYVDGIARS